MKAFTPESVKGKTFGRWTAGDLLRRAGCWHVACVCTCGSSKAVKLHSLVHGKSLSCGCLNREALLAKTTKHGGCRRTAPHDQEYNVWALMIARCERKSRPDYENYGGRGISVCEKWKASYAALKENSGNYEPGNVRWATSVEQNNNRRNNCILEFSGKRQTLAEWGRELGINPLTLRQRFAVYGWSVEETLTTPVRR